MTSRSVDPMEHKDANIESEETEETRAEISKKKAHNGKKEKKKKKKAREGSKPGKKERT